MATNNLHTGDEVKEPYVGPRPFEEKDEDIFFGREQETNELISLIVAHPLVLLYSQSGAGKTSLLKASLLPILKKRKIEVLPPARVRGQGTQPDDVPDGTNIYVVNALEYLSGNSLNPNQRAGMSLTDFLPPRQQVNKREVLPLRVIIFDQFEEIFTVYPERFEDRQNFFEQVRNALEADTLLRIVFAMREDFIAELDPYTSILPERLQTRYRLMRLNEDTARAAIEKPLERANRSRSLQFVFEPSAADKLLDNLRTIYVKTSKSEKTLLGPFIEPVHLQVVCQTLWRKMGASFSQSTEKEVMITENDVKEFGDVNNALSEFYEVSLQAALETVAEAARKSDKSLKLTEGNLRAWFGRTLITMAGTRGIVFGGRGDETVGGIPRAAINELEKQRLIRAELRGSEMWYELSHDRFIQPIRDSNEKWLRKQPLAQRKAQELEAKATEWAATNKSRALLLDQADLRDAKRWMESPEAAGIGYSDTLFAFIQASQAAQQQRRVRQLVAGSALLVTLLVLSAGSAAYAIKQTAVAQAAEANALAQEKRAEAESRAAREAETDAKDSAAEALRQRSIADEQKEVARKSEAKAISESQVARAAEAKARKQQQAADAARVEAENQRLAAKRSATLATARAIEAEKARVESEQQTKIALSREVAASAVSKLQADPELSTLLASEAVRINPTEEAASALRASVSSLHDTRAVLSGHTDAVTEATFISDDNFVLTVASDDSIKFWNVSLNDSKQLVTLIGRDASFSEYGDRLSTITPTDTTRALVWDTKTMQKIVELDEPSDITSLAISPDGKLAVVARKDLIIRVHDISSKKYVDITSYSHQGRVQSISLTSIVFSPNSKRFAVTSVDQGDKAHVSVWDISGESIFNFADNTSPLALSTITFSPDGRFLITSSENFARVIDLSKTFRSETVELHGHTGVITSMSFSPNGQYLVTTSADNTARIWNTSTWQIQAVLVGHTNAIRRASFSHDNKYVVTASFDNTARIWDASTGQALDVIRGHSGSVNSAIFSPDDKYVLTASTDKSARIWPVNTKPSLIVLKGHTGSVNTASISHDGKLVATASDDSTARIWDVSTGRIIKLLRVSEGSIYSAAFSPNGKYLVTAGGDRIARVWDIITAKEVASLKGHTSNISGASFSPDGELVATASDDHTVRLWEWKTGHLLKMFEGPDAMFRVVFSHDGRYIAAACFDGTAFVWDLNDGKLLKMTRRGAYRIYSVAFSPDERYLVTADSNEAHVWDLSTGERIATLSEHGGGPLSVAFSHNGKYIVTGSNDNTAQVWEVGTWKVLAELRGHTDIITSVEFDPSDTFIVTASLDGTARIYQQLTVVTLDQLLQIASRRVTRPLTMEERVQYLHFVSKQ